MDFIGLLFPTRFGREGGYFAGSVYMIVMHQDGDESDDGNDDEDDGNNNDDNNDDDNHNHNSDHNTGPNNDNKKSV